MTTSEYSYSWGIVNSCDILAKLKVSANGLSFWLSEFFNKCMAKG